MMLQAMLRRAGVGVGTLFIVSVLIFVGTSVLPGDVAQIILGQMATPETLAVLRANYGTRRFINRQSRIWNIDNPSGKCHFGAVPGNDR